MQFFSFGIAVRCGAVRINRDKKTHRTEPWKIRKYRVSRSILTPKAACMHAILIQFYSPLSSVCIYLHFLFFWTGRHIHHTDVRYDTYRHSSRRTHQAWETGSYSSEGLCFVHIQDNGMLVVKAGTDPTAAGNVLWSNNQGGPVLVRKKRRGKERTCVHVSGAT